MISTRLVDLPCRVRGFCTKSVDDNGDDCYTIVLNSALSIEQQKKTYLHELKHIEGGDFYLNCSVDTIERLAHDD